MGDHTTADDASRYRDPSVLDEQKTLDPLHRLRIYLTEKHEWNEDKEASLHAECSSKVEQAVNEYLDTPPMPPESMFDYLYETLPKAYQWQREEMAKRGGK